MAATRYSYDLFLSHSHADKAWVHALADRLAAERWHGRLLRPWLDEQVLDPGRLGSDAELTTALDRSRLLGLVLSPESVASRYVGLGVEHFLSRRAAGQVVLMLLRDCTLPPGLEALRDAGAGRIDFRAADKFEAGLRALLQQVRPAGGESPADVARQVDAAVAAFEAADEGGFAAGPTAERDAVHAALSRHDIDDAAQEGLALAGFHRATEHLIRLHKTGSDAAYNFKMLLAECLVASLLRSNGYRVVVQYLLGRDAPEIPFVIARAYAKVADTDPARVDLSALLRVAARLDAQPGLSNEERAVEALLARAAGKLRGTAVGELLIKTLSERGRTSRVAASGGIVLGSARSGPVFYLSALDQAAADGTPIDAPTRRLLGLLKGLETDPDPYVRDRVKLARQDLEHDWPGLDLPYPLFWHPRRPAVPALHPTHAPFLGVVARAGLADMGDRAERTEVSTVACLTEPRVVDALFWNSGALLVPEQDPDSQQCRRLRARGVPFAMLAAAELEALEDGDLVVVDEETFTVWAPTR